MVSTRPTRCLAGLGMDNKHRAPAVMMASDRNQAPPKPNCGVPKNERSVAPNGVGAAQDHKDTRAGIVTKGCHSALQTVVGVWWASSANPSAQMAALANNANMTGSA